mmetsp:Transcript_32717/g.93973  ORF Transcript_32717/g.93973 Transcript_32717/m.93973 type:complete len:218 (-) Transcript_32717:269-922(-)
MNYDVDEVDDPVEEQALPDEIREEQRNHRQLAAWLKRQEAGQLIHGPQLLQVDVVVDDDHAVGVAEEGGEAPYACLLAVLVRLVDADFVEEARCSATSSASLREVHADLLPMKEDQEEGRRPQQQGVGTEELVLAGGAPRRKEGQGAHGRQHGGAERKAQRGADGRHEVETQREDPVLLLARRDPVVGDEHIDVPHLEGHVVRPVIAGAVVQNSPTL